MYIKGILRIVETDKDYPDEGDFVIRENGEKSFHERGDFLQGVFKVCDVYISKESGERLVEHTDFNESLKEALVANWDEDEEGFNDGREFVVHIKYLPTVTGWQEKVIFKKWRYRPDEEVKAHIYPWSIREKLIKLHGRMVVWNRQKSTNSMKRIWNSLIVNLKKMNVQKSSLRV